ncbi:hypothetical protein MNBD_DELTA03-1744 [hydrothermal vent metagenome]|uniref:NAD-dependent epimerase/dehydratase domain-containing protein n=1 Tax=hydrothermal vent metagenome TaxID=652676 RepID=A0A3B0VLH7_9ZZZZ
MPRECCQLKPGTSVLVTGATGFTGMNLTKKLVEAGVRVRAVARQSSDLTPLEGLDIQWIRGEVFDGAVIAEAMAGQEYVFHVAAAYRDPSCTLEDYRNVHIESTRLIAEEAARSPQFKRFIHVSTVGVHGHIARPPADERYPFDPGDDYQQTKLEAEQWLVKFAAAKSLPYTVIRPAAIYGPGDRRLLKVFQMAMKPYFILLGKGKCLYHLVHVDDLTNAMLTASTHPAAQGEVFIIGDTDSVTIDGMARIVADYFGRKFRVVRLPIGPFFLAGDICEMLCRPFGLQPPIYRRRVALYSKDRAFDVSKMKSILGFLPRHSNKDGLEETAQWYAKQGWLKL